MITIASISFFLYQVQAQTLVHAGLKNVTLIVSTDNYHFFKADDASGVSQVWRTDGTPNGALQLTHMDVQGSFPFFNNEFVKLNNIVFFNLYTPSEGEELWRTDGTPEGTFMIDIRPGAESAFSADDRTSTILATPFVMNGYIVFLANDGIHGAEPWRSDGTSAGTYMLADTEVGVSSTGGIMLGGSPARVGNLFYFSVVDHNVGAYAFLYRTDGTVNGTFKVAHGLNYEIVDVFGKAYFFHRDQIWTQPEQWVSDGTIDGTHFLYTVQNQQEKLIPVRNDLLFYFGKTAQTETEKKALFKTDSDGNNTELLFDNLATGYERAKILNEKLFFMMDEPALSKLSLGISDGTVAGSTIYQTHTAKTDYTYSPLFQVDDKFVYGWPNLQVKMEYWITDGTPEGTQTLRNSALGMPQNSSFNVWSALYWKNKYIINAHAYGNNQTYIDDFCLTDGTTAGTVRLTHFKEKITEEYNKSAPYSFKNSLLINITHLDTSEEAIYIYTDPELTAPQVGTPLCKGGSYSVVNKPVGEFAADNVFSVQLSDASGNFGSPVTIGSESTDQAGTINVTIPANATNGNGYRIRIVSTNPALVGANNGTNITINAPVAPVIATSMPYNLCPPQSKTLTASACAGTINWSSSGTGSSTVVSPTATTTYYATCTQNGCVSAQSNSITINVANTMFSLKSGNWNDASVWSCGEIPTATRDVLIKSGHKILLSGTMGIQQCKLLTVETGAIFQNEGRYFVSKP